MKRSIEKGLIFFLGILLVSCNSQPDLKNPTEFKIENIEFSIPNNWYEGKKGEDNNIGFKWTNIKSPDNFVFGIQHYNKKYEYEINDLVDYYLKNLQTKMKDNFLETEILNKREKFNLQIMGKEVEGIEIEYKNKVLNIVVDQRTQFFQYVTDSCTCIFTATTNIEDWEKEQKGFELILNTLKIK